MCGECVRLVGLVVVLNTSYSADFTENLFDLLSTVTPAFSVAGGACKSSLIL